METIFYSVDVANLLKIQNDQRIINNLEAEVLNKQCIENKKELLKYVLPLVHGLIVLHNNKCNRDLTTTTSKSGLLANSPIDIEDKINDIINCNSSITWSQNNIKFYYSFGDIKITMWLNKDGKHATSINSTYSMLGLLPQSGVYSKGIENELVLVAKHCAKFTTEW